MEKIPVASAMEWSIQLEKGLRSKNPRKSVEEILKFGQRLKLLNNNRKVRMVEHQVFDLIPGEDKLFINTICLRLADAFRSGSKEIKSCVVKVFLEVFKSRRKRDSCSKNVGGSILDKLDNKLELLKKVKIVFDEGDVEERALALVLFGCCASFAKDSADIRYGVFSSLRSNHIHEVKASLFAARCFAELTDDFGFVLLQIFVNLLTSSQLPFDMKLAVGRAFANFSSSFQVANEAYMAGLEMVLDLSEEQFSNVMMVSLTKISSKWTLLIPKQVDFLLKFLAGNIVLGIKATALKCLHFILAGRLCTFPWTTNRIQNLVQIIDESPALNYEALKVLHKILMYNVPSFSILEIGEVFSLLLSFAEKTIHSPNVSYRLQAFCYLVDVSGHIFIKSKDSTIACKIISVIMDRMFLLANTKQIDAKVEQEIITLLKLLLNLVQRQVQISGLVLDRLCSFILYLENILYQDSSASLEGIMTEKSLNFDKEHLIEVLFKSSLCLSRVMIASEKTELFYDTTSQILSSTRMLMENMLKPLVFHSYTSTSYLLLLQSYSSYHYISRVMKQGYFGRDASPFCGNSVPDYELLGLECAKKVVEERDYWSCYKAGKYAACQGSWSIASFIFEQLTAKVQSASCSWWMKSLTLFSSFESQIQRLGSLLFKDCICKEETVWKINSCDYAEILVELQNTLQLVKEKPGSSFSGVDFTLQKWLLALRVGGLEAVLDIIRLLSTASSKKDNSNNLVSSCRQIAYKLTRIAYEFDFLVTSFIDMDKKSAMIISALALGCSLLAFTTTFTLPLPSRATQEMECGGFDNSLSQLCVELIQDLHGRLWCLDSECSKSLQVLLKVYQNPTSCSSVDSRDQPAYISGESRIIAKLCQYSIPEIIRLQNDTRKLCNSRGITQISNDGIKLLLNIISRWMQIPFRCPNNFFQVKPFLSSELFVMNGNGENIHMKSFSTSSHLQLNLCLRLKHTPPSFTIRLSKLYCILSFEMLTSNVEIRDEFCLNNKEPQPIDDTLKLNEKLSQHVKGSVKTPSIILRTDIGYHCVDDKYVCFNSLDNGQGFSCCFLDISSFSAGLYQVKWHSCFVDSEGSYWSILPQNCGPIFNVVRS